MLILACNDAYVLNIFESSSVFHMFNLPCTDCSGLDNLSELKWFVISLFVGSPLDLCKSHWTLSLIIKPRIE